ncbi:MAG: hypothetical protein HQK49_16820 [Oligoflexia bacterium]|nr:hypothetical protein [Oligoflexia bacterium]
MNSKTIAFFSLFFFIIIINVDRAEAMSLELTKHGFDVLGEGVKFYLNNDNKEHSISDKEFSVPMLAKISVSDLTFKTDVASISFTPHKDGLSFKMLIKALKISVGEMEIRNSMFSFVKNGCEGTEIILGDGEESPLEVSGDLGMSFYDNRLNLELESFDFYIEKDQFEVVGPSYCYGPFGIRSRMQSFILHYMLGYIRPFLNWTLETQLKFVAFAAENLIAEAANFTIPISIPQIPQIQIIPATTLYLNTYPTDFSISKKSLKLDLSVNVEKDNFKAVTTKAIVEPPLLLGERIGTLGIEPLLINQLLHAFFKNGSLPMEITKASSAEIAPMLSRMELSSFWPDLEKVAADSDEMRINLKILQVPSINAIWDNPQGKIQFDLPKLLLTFKILQNKKWINYYDLKLSLKATVAPTVSGGKILLKLSEPKYSISGEWAYGYTPTINEFNKEGLEGLLNTIFSMMAASNEPISLKAPIIPIGNYKVTLDNLLIKQPYISFDIREVLAL